VGDLLSQKVKLNWVFIQEMAFRAVPNWWPRAFLALSALYTYKFHAYMASPVELKEWAKKNNVSYRTILRGLKKLIEEGLVRSEGSYYILTPQGTQLAKLILQEMAEIKDIIEGASDIHELETKSNEFKGRLKHVADVIRGKIPNSEVAMYALSFLESYLNTAVTILKNIMQNIKAEEEIMEILKR